MRLRTGTRCLALGLALSGLALWGRGYRAVALGCFAAAGLTRETMLLIPCVLSARLAWKGEFRQALLVAAVSATPIVLWTAWVEANIGNGEGYQSDPCSWWHAGTLDAKRNYAHDVFSSLFLRHLSSPID